MDLFALDRQVDFRTIFVAGEGIELRAESFLQQITEVVARRCCPAGAAFRWHGCFLYVIDRLVRSVGADVDELFDLCRGAEPDKLRPIELNFFFSDQLIEIKAGSHSSEGEPVGLSNFVKVVSR